MKRTAEKALLRRYVSPFFDTVLLTVLLLIAAPAFATSVSFVVLQKDNKPLAGVVVTAEPESGKASANHTKAAGVD